jgi:hypothetical protein
MNNLITPKQMSKDIDRIVDEACDKFGRDEETRKKFKMYFKAWILGDGEDNNTTVIN